MRREDHGPMVAAVQVLLNRCAVTKPLKVDGQFGPLTEAVVEAFQDAQHVSGASRVVDAPTWEALSSLFKLSIIDAVDVYDPAHDELMPAEMRGYGLVSTGGMSNGVESIVDAVIERARCNGKIALLRFQGHGGPGLMGLSSGTGSLRDGNGNILYRCRVPAIGADERATLESANCPPGPKGRNAVRFRYYDERTVISDRSFLHLESALRRLRSHFASFGSVELHGCQIGKGVRGDRLLAQLCRTIGVPVSASLDFQYFARRSDPQAAFRFEGRVVTVFDQPGGLHAWARAIAGAEAAPLASVQP